MIVIHSQQDESTTDDVLDWLYYFGMEQVKRVNGTNPINAKALRINNHTQHSNLFDDAESSAINAYWYRRGHLACEISEPIKLGYSGFVTYFEKEYDHLTKGISQVFKQYRNINSFEDTGTNKLTNLAVAAGVDLLIPDTLVTADVKAIKAFSAIYPRIITKAIGHNRITATIDDNSYINIAVDTAIFDQDKINALPEENNFLPAVFQEYLEKKYELRIFYFHGQVYSMAIFSQLNEATKVDFRKHDTETPNRCVPYQLPEDIEKKLGRFMQHIAMNSGSIDMVVTPSGEHVFLEVNPVGQLQWLSANCNYPIEREIAKFLLHDS
ncbi:grasp-with-spasm system ATP-grasp peptide maturase [Taibaiella chishuiensis]|uniref:ATP-GRASP peptide maturase of grasp-with-spasm system n=1 Tax=Taibaiella chishuiensis TaxID=1434707 RepID=A0A2P8D1E0_9BACT|nr:grasp-with-spasm system ATP-grasp peptide maturase [Taibaiella chishuiensis]PSK91034.1 ATP-GRASP peptide maturase of grasp-with-spasm system [Taibaiella chishuiensis]